MWDTWTHEQDTFSGPSAPEGSIEECGQKADSLIFKDPNPLRELTMTKAVYLAHAAKGNIGHQKGYLH